METVGSEKEEVAKKKNRVGQESFRSQVRHKNDSVIVEAAQTKIH